MFQSDTTHIRRVTIVSFQPCIEGKVGGMGAFGLILARALHRQGHKLSFHVINTVGETEPYVRKVHASAKLFLFLTSFFFNRGWLRNTSKRKLEEWYFDFFLSLSDLSGDTLITTTPMIPRTLKKVKQRFKQVILIPPNPNEQYIRQLCLEELAAFGVAETLDDPYLDAVRVRHQQEAISYVDTILSISKVVHDSYRGFAGRRLLQQYYLLPALQRRENASLPADNFVYIYIAHTVLLKGLHRLLEAWRACNFESASLWIVGAVNEDYARAFHMEAQDEKIKFLGLRRDIASLLEQAHCVVIPSLIDNEPKTAIEGLLAHKPVLISSGCGNAAIIASSVPEAIFDVTDTTQLTEQLKDIQFHYDHWQQRFETLYRQVAAEGSGQMELQFIEKVKSLL